MTSILQSQQKKPRVWRGHKPKPSSNSILKRIAKEKGRGK